MSTLDPMGQHKPTVATTSGFGAYDWLVLVAVTAFAAALAIFEIRSNDVWWMLATGRRMMESGFITQDSFTFTVEGRPWSPQTPVAAVIFYWIHKMLGANGLIALRVLAVVTTTLLLFRAAHRAGARWLYTGLPIVLFLLITHSRFTIRGHLFEYVWLAILVGVLFARDVRLRPETIAALGVMQVWWANTHASYPIAPALVAAFIVGEWIARRFFPKGSVGGGSLRLWLVLLVVLAGASLINPNPIGFIQQAFSNDMRDLLQRFTLEWKSPFDPAMRDAPFHPYFGVMIFVILASTVLALRTLPLAWVLMMGIPLVAALQVHRFRVEMAIVGVTYIAAIGARGNVWAPLLRQELMRRWVGPVTAVATALFVVAHAGLVQVSGGVADRYPKGALDFVRQHNIARRSYHTIGFGSYLIWEAYGERKSFIDGRNFVPALYREFIATQQTAEGFGQVAASRELDAVMIPPPEGSDTGMRNVHNAVARPGWALVYVDHVAWVYVNESTTDAEWADRFAYRAYVPGLLPTEGLSPEQFARLTAEVERAVASAPGYVTPLVDWAVIESAQGKYSDAFDSLLRAERLAPEDPLVLFRLGQIAIQAGNKAKAVEVLEKLQQRFPDREDIRQFLRQAQAM